MDKRKKESWDSSEGWYSRIVGEKGHYYHQSVVLSSSLRLLGLKGKGSLLDLGCGQGVLARDIPAEIDYWGADYSKALIDTAKKLTKRARAQFVVADVEDQLPIDKMDFDWACFILSLQNMENQHRAIATASRHLKKGGKLLIVLNHPCFRIPRQSAWGVDEQAKLQYRRLNLYMSPQKIPIQTAPSKGEQSSVTYSYHYPLSDYTTWLQKEDLLIETMEEWCSDKKSEGTKAKMEDRARREFPLFIAILAVKNE